MFYLHVNSYKESQTTIKRITQTGFDPMHVNSYEESQTTIKKNNLNRVRSYEPHVVTKPHSGCSFSKPLKQERIIISDV